MKAITVRYFGPTNFRGSRLIASEPDGKRIILPYPHELNRDEGYRKAAYALRDKLGRKGEMISGWTGKAEVFVFVE